MFSAMRFATLGAILALASGVLYATVTLSPSPGGLTSSPSPTASPIALPEPVGRPADLEAGTTYFYDDVWEVGSADLILTVPATGWLHNGNSHLAKSPIAGGWFEVLITPWWRPRNLSADPCHWRSGGELDPPVGPTADDLATALVEQAAGNASAPTDVTVSGYPGKRVELSLPAGLDIATCDGGEFTRWWDELGDNLRGPYMYPEADGRNIVYILDVGDKRAVIDTLYTPGASEADLAEAEQLIASMRFEWPAPGPSPSA